MAKLTTRRNHVDNSFSTRLPCTVLITWCRPFDLTFNRPVIYGEAIVLPPSPIEPVLNLLDSLRAGIADARVPTSPEQAGGFRPHVSLTYSGAEHNSTPYAAAHPDPGHPASSAAAASAAELAYELPAE